VKSRERGRAEAGRRKIPFRVALIGVVVGLLTATGSSLAVFAFVKELQSIDVLRREYVEQVAGAAVREVSRLPRLAETILVAHRALVLKRVLPTEDSAALGVAFAGVLEASPELAWLSFGDERSGRFAGANRLGSGQIVLNQSDPGRNGGVPEEFRIGARGELEAFRRTPPVTEAYDPRAEHWYRKAAGAAGIVWLPPYEFAEGETGITAAVAVREEPGARLRGVLTADFSLQGIDRFLRSLAVGAGGGVLLFTGDEFLGGRPGAGREAVARALHGRNWAARTAGSTRATVGGVRYEVAARPFSHGTGLDWAVVIYVADDEFMGPVYANLRATVAITVAGLILAVGVGILVSTVIARSLGGAATDLDRIARFTISDAPVRDSIVKEIWLLQQAVGRVKASLRSFTRYAPEEIVREVIVSGREAMLSGEKREVSVLFCDLRGFTSFSEKTRPEEVIAILNDHFGALAPLVAEHGGFVVDFLGDSLFAVFGAPQAGADHAARAVACAIEMQAVRLAGDETNFARGWPPLEIGIGINTGVAIVGNMGSQRRIKYGVVGHVVNLAARIETFTVGGQVLVSESTRAALGDRLRAAGPLRAEGKGVEGAIQMWDVRGLRGDVARELPSPARDLVPLARPVPARVRLIHAKQIDAEVHPADLLRLGSTVAEVRSAVPLPVFSEAQVSFAWEDGTAAALDGKVMGTPGSGGVMVRFGGLDWATRARLLALAQSRA
jgi:class 3 adenylate cyclase